MPSAPLRETRSFRPDRLATVEAKSDRPCSLNTTASPSSIAVDTGSRLASAAIAANRSVQSWPPRVRMRTPDDSMWTARR